MRRLRAPAAVLRGLPIDRIVGPAFIGYGTRENMGPSLSLADTATRMKREHDAAVHALREGCTEEEWSHGGSNQRAVPAFGRFDDTGELAALAGYATWSDEIAHIAVVAAPGHRGAGHATVVVAAAARHALDAALLPQYRTLLANEPSMAIARRLGFERYGSSVFVRLADR
ncbi:MAG: GNAT family N-acetyltransferase [Planctomycetota bacterium]